MKIAFGSDHAGFATKDFLCAKMNERGIEAIDLGPNAPIPVDYPDYAAKVAKLVAAGGADFGVLVCGTGIGMSIAANKFKGVRAALCLTPEYAQLARRHNNANILCTSGRFITAEQALVILEQFICTQFDGDTEQGLRHKTRVEKISEIEES